MINELTGKIVKIEKKDAYNEEEKTTTHKIVIKTELGQTITITDTNEFSGAVAGQFLTLKIFNPQKTLV